MVESRKTNKKVVYSTLSSKNQITLPSMIREKLGAEPGDQVGFDYNVETKEVIVSVLKRDSLLSLYGSMPPKGENVQKEWNMIRKEAREESFKQKYEE